MSSQPNLPSGPQCICSEKYVCERHFDPEMPNGILLLPASTKHFRGHKGIVDHVVLMPCGSKIASSSEDGSVRIYALATGECLHTFRVRRELETSINMLLTLDEDLLLSIHKGCPHVWRVSNGELLKVYRFCGLLVKCHQEGKDIFVQLERSYLNPVWYQMHWDGKELSMKRRGIPIDSHDVSDSPNDLFATLSNVISVDADVYIWSRRTFGLVRTITGERRSISCVALNDMYFLTGSYAGIVSAFNATDFSYQASTLAHNSVVSSILFLECGKKVILGSFDRTISVYSLPTLTLEWRMEVGIKVTSMALLRGNYVLISASDPFEVLLFQIPGCTEKNADEKSTDRKDHPLGG